MLKWTLYFLTYYVCLTQSSEVCHHPAVPFAAKYLNVTGGLDEDNWTIKYICDSGYELFGEESRECQQGQWKGDLPHCAVNVALNKPATASSQAGKGDPNNGVDGRKSTVHEGDKCTETKSEKSPWWTVDLLGSYSVKHVRLTTRCCDDVPIKKAEIRVGNSTTPGKNPLCNWIPKALEEGTTETLECVEDIMGRYVSIMMTGVETVLSVCEVEVFSTEEISLSNCPDDIPQDEVSVFQDACYHFVPEEVSGYDEAKALCEENESHLVADLDEFSLPYVTSRLQRKLDSKSDVQSLMAWIGAQREAGLGKEEWTWVTGNTVETIEWGRGQPNNYNQEQNCAVLDSELEWKWNDISCKISAVTVCQSSPSKCASPAVNEGTFFSGDLTVGSQISYHCPIGDMPVGDANQTCEISGQFSGQPITCKKVDCGQVPGLVDGEIHVLDGRTTWGARVKYKCKDNYNLMSGDETRTCEEEGWSGKAPTCVYARCPEPDTVENAYLKKDGDNSVGSKLIYTCHEGHKASGSMSRECELGGKWSGITPKCEFVDCGDAPAVKNADVQLLDGRTSFGAEVEYSCGADYILSGNSKKTCDASGQWTRSEISCNIIECPPPRAPNGGRVSGYNTEIHSKIEFSCLTGHILEGEEVLTCTRSGQWSSSSPICRFIDCGAVPPVPSGTAHYVNGSTHLGSMVRYACDRSYNLEGNAERFCEENSRWSGDPPRCSEIRCPIPDRPNNTIISVSSTERLHGTSVIRSKPSTTSAYRVGSTLKYRCERGYILEKEDGSDARVMTRRCTTSGTWTGSMPSCKFVNCGTPELPENSEVSLQNNGTYFGSMSFYKCKPNFNLDGFERRRCESDGKWKPEAPTCKETLCKPLSQPDNGALVLTTLRIGGRATFSCQTGFALKGDDDIECLSSGSWSAWPPSCIEIDCGQPDKIENGRIFLTNQTTTIGSTVEYHCFPGFERSGPFERTCYEDGYWSGKEPSCSKPRPITILSDNTVDGTKNVRAGSISEEVGGGSSSVGMWIGVALGLIVVIGLLILGVYFYRKQRSITSKPAPFRDRNSNGVSNGGGPTPNGTAAYTMSGIYPVAGVSGVNGRIGGRPPPPPIQMYSMDDGGGLDDPTRAPIYDTINDDSSGSVYSQSNGSGGSNKGGGNYAPTSTFSPGQSNGYPPPPHRTVNGNGVVNEYDVPEGSEGRPAKVTINGIAV